MMPSPDATISTLLGWCSDNGIWIDPRLAVVQDTENGGLRVCNNSGTRINDGVTCKHTFTRVGHRT